MAFKRLFEKLGEVKCFSFFFFLFKASWRILFSCFFWKHYIWLVFIYLFIYFCSEETINYSRSFLALIYWCRYTLIVVYIVLYLLFGPKVRKSSYNQVFMALFNIERITLHDVMYQVYFFVLFFRLIKTILCCQFLLHIFFLFWE